MPRELSIGNGSLQVMFDAQYRLRDIYYPYVGKENHAGHAFRFGVFADGQMSWTDSPDWERRINYAPATLVTAVELLNRRLKIRLGFLRKCLPARSHGRKSVESATRDRAVFPS